MQAKWISSIGVRIAVMAATALLCFGTAIADTVRQVAVGEGATAKTYELSEYDSAKAYINAYSDNVRRDISFKAHEAIALDTIRKRNRFFGTWWSVFPPLLAIILTLLTKEVYSSLFAGIVAGGLLDSEFSLNGTMTKVTTDGFIKALADPYNAGILMFLVLLGALVAMMNRTGASAAFGRWAAANVRSRVGAQTSTTLLGLAIFIDDYFNCLTVGGVMRPVTDAKHVSRAKLAYLIDSTAAPICIIAPISSWAAAVAGFAKDAGAASGLALFVNAIPYNFYAILTIVTMFAVAFFRLDFGPMKRHEDAVTSGQPDPGALASNAKAAEAVGHGGISDLFVPMLALTTACTLGMAYSGGFFEGDASGDFFKAFAAADASVGLAYGSLAATLFAMVFYICRRTATFHDCMGSIPEGFRMMVPAIIILCCAWTLKGTTDALGAKVFIADFVNDAAASLMNFLPAIIFAISALLAFATGTSWGTFGILIPIVLSAVPDSELTITAISACMAGAVCGDHCSPISDTTIMASAGAQCKHVEHVATQLPYVLLVASVSFASYIVAPFVGNIWISLPLAIALMCVALFALAMVTGRHHLRNPTKTPYGQC